ncbi:hypothetical protein VNI00_012957 [Paramarasmius palmivorus]|uniref:Uncharacterized protein n=1 Tax=Paramarasmius palmivorus TaxID=297713 RepID=A0AAW0C1G3_9AGAR
MFNNHGGFDIKGGAFNNVNGNQYNNSGRGNQYNNEGSGPQHVDGTQHYGGTQNQYFDGSHYNNTGDGPQHVNSGNGTQNSHTIDSRSQGFVHPYHAGWGLSQPDEDYPQYNTERNSGYPLTNDWHPYPPLLAVSQRDGYTRGAPPPVQRPASRPTAHYAPGNVEEGYAHANSPSSQIDYVSSDTSALRQSDRKGTHGRAPKPGEVGDDDRDADEGVGEVEGRSISDAE